MMPCLSCCDGRTRFNTAPLARVSGSMYNDTETINTCFECVSWFPFQFKSQPRPAPPAILRNRLLLLSHLSLVLTAVCADSRPALGSALTPTQAVRPWQEVRIEPLVDRTVLSGWKKHRRPEGAPIPGSCVLRHQLDRERASRGCCAVGARGVEKERTQQ